MYKYACLKVTYILEQLGKYEFQSDIDKSNLTIQQLTMCDNGKYIYFGQIDPGNDKHEGQGIQVWDNGGIHEGYWHDGVAHGVGRRIYANGQVYEGSWVDGERSGYGVCTWPDKARYEGEKTGI